MSRLPAPYDPEFSGQRPESGLALEEEPEPLLELSGRRHTVLVTGALGFLGRELVPRLLHRGHRVRGLVRQLPPPDHELRERIEWWQADVTRPEEVSGAARDCDRIVHLAGSAPPGLSRRTGPEVDVRATGTVAEEAEVAGVERMLYISSLGAGPGREGFYGEKHRAEQEVLARDLEVLIFRPAVMYGPGDFLTSRLRRAARAGRWVPVPGSADFRIQPVAVEDVVEALCQGVERPGFEERAFELGGPRPLSFTEVVEAVGDAMGRRLRVLGISGPVAPPAWKVLETVGGGAGLTSEEAEWLRRQGVLTAAEHALRAVFRLEPLPFEEALRDYLC